MNILDLKILKSARAGNNKSIDYLFQTYNKTAFNISYRIVQRADIAEDIVMDCFHKILEKDHEIKENFSAYFFRMIVNYSLNHIRKEKHENICPNEFNYDLIAEDNPDKELENKELLLRLKQAINNLPENQKTALILTKYEDLSYKETAEILNTTIKSVEGLITRAKQKIKEELSDLIK